VLVVWLLAVLCPVARWRENRMWWLLPEHGTSHWQRIVNRKRHCSVTAGGIRFPEQCDFR